MAATVESDSEPNVSPREPAAAGNPSSLLTYPDRDGRREATIEGWFRVVFAIVLVGFLILAAFDVFGQATATTRTSASGFDLELRYADASRAGLVTPWHLDIRRSDGSPLESPVAIEINRSYLDVYENPDPRPVPASAHSRGDSLVWVFEVPPGSEQLSVSLESRIDPGVHSGREGTVTLLDSDGSPLVALRFYTRIAP